MRLCGREKTYEAAAIRNTLSYCVSEQDMSLWIHSLPICDTSVPNCVHVWAHGHVDLWAFQLHLMCLSVCLPFSDSVALYAFGQPSVCSCRCTMHSSNEEQVFSPSVIICPLSSGGIEGGCGGMWMNFTLMKGYFVSGCLETWIFLSYKQLSSCPDYASLQKIRAQRCPRLKMN